MWLQDRKVLITVADGFDERELYYPYYRLQEAGADVILAGAQKTTYTGKKGYVVEATSVGPQNPEEFEAVIIPGGFAPDKLRVIPAMVSFVKDVFDNGKLVAAICHGGWLLAEARIVTGLRLTSYPSIRTDLENAGAQWVDKPVVVDGNLITSRVPDDLPYFMREILVFMESQ